MQRAFPASDSRTRRRPARPSTPEIGWRVGLDLGSSTTAYRELYRAAPRDLRKQRRVLTTTAIGYPDGVEPGACHEMPNVEIGERALNSSAVKRLIYPLRSSGDERRPALLDFVRRLRAEVGQNRDGAPWGVISRPAAVPAGHVSELLDVAGEFFARAILVEESRLLSLGLNDTIRAPYSILIDLGASGTRFYLRIGRSHQPACEVEVEHGGDMVDRLIAKGIKDAYPDLYVSDITVTQIKEQLGFVPPDDRVATLELTFGSARKQVDLTEIVRSACETWVEAVLGGVQQMISICPRHELERQLDEIYLVGGGAMLFGLAERLRIDLRSRGNLVSRVNVVPDSRVAIAAGALKWPLTSLVT